MFVVLVVVDSRILLFMVCLICYVLVMWLVCMCVFSVVIGCRFSLCSSVRLCFICLNMGLISSVLLWVVLFSR